ncbi:MAG: folate-binding protein, partial [Angustibacter sp.]
MSAANPFVTRPGFVAAEGRAAGIAAHYGDPMREQRLLVEGLAIVDQSHRGVLTIAGPDRLSWLNSLTTAKILDLAPGESAETLILSPKGHIEHSLDVVDDGERLWCITE